METITTTVTDLQVGCEAPLSFSADVAIVIVCCVLGLLWSLFNVLLVNKINVNSSDQGDSEGRLVGDIPKEQKELLIELGDKIANVHIR